MTEGHFGGELEENWGLTPISPISLILNLLADDAGAKPIEMLGSGDLHSAAQALLDQIRPELDFGEGEVTMFVMDMPDLPPQYAQVMIAQAVISEQGAAKIDRAIGVCQLIENVPNEPPTAINSMSPIGWVRNYFGVVENRKVEGSPTVTVLENPKNGELRDEGVVIDSDTGKAREYSYLPAPGYFGKDRAVLLVDLGGMKIKLVYSFHVVQVVTDERERKLCPKPYWRISDATDTSRDLLTTQDPVQWNLDATGGVDSNIAFSDLPGTAVGQTTANTITLDLDAAGHKDSGV